jgi:uncharacterized membrane protein YczE
MVACDRQTTDRDPTWTFVWMVLYVALLSMPIGASIYYIAELTVGPVSNFFAGSTLGGL